MKAEKKKLVMIWERIKDHVLCHLWRKSLSDEDIRKWNAFFDRNPTEGWLLYRDNIEALECAVPGIIHLSLQRIDNGKQGDGLDKKHVFND